MRLDNDTVIVAAGFAVLTVSLALPVVQQLAAKNEVQNVAARAVELKQELMASANPAATLKTKVGDLVEGLSPDAALADARANDKEFVGPLVHSVAASSDDVVGADTHRDTAYKVIAEWDAGGQAKMRVKRDGRGSSWTWGGQ